MDLIQFAKTYLEVSENTENLRGRGKVTRISVERLCAGPAIPLLYDFFATRHPELERTLEKEGHNFNDLTSKIIIKKGLEDKDPLCMRVIEKFTEIFGMEVGNFALKTLSFGGVYLIGGVTMGIEQYLRNNDTFLKNFNMKGRLEKYMKRFPIYLVKNETNVGLLGAEERAFRILEKLEH